MRATVSDVRALVETELTDSQIESIIALANKKINAIAGDENNDLLTLAEIYLSVSFVLKRMKTNGELPDSLKVGEISQNVKIDEMIKSYEDEAMKLVKKYLISKSAVVIYTRAGIDWKNKEPMGDY